MGGSIGHNRIQNGLNASTIAMQAITIHAINYIRHICIGHNYIGHRDISRNYIQDKRSKCLDLLGLDFRQVSAPSTHLLAYGPPASYVLSPVSFRTPHLQTHARMGHVYPPRHTRTSAGIHPHIFGHLMAITI